MHEETPKTMTTAELDLLNAVSGLVQCAYGLVAQKHHWQTDSVEDVRFRLKQIRLLADDVKKAADALERMVL
jgi:hypothetical protein